MIITDPLLSRFEAKFQQTMSGCWVWTAALDEDGYGLFRLNGETLQAHRLAYELYIAALPKNVGVYQSCRNLACVNPDHLHAET